MKNRTAILGLVFFLILATPCLYIAEHAGRAAELNFWLHILAGGWPTPTVGYPRASPEFSIGIILAILMHLGAILLLVELAMVIRRDTEKAMNLAQTLKLRDRSIKNSLLVLFPEDQRSGMRTLIEEAFKAGNGVWETKHLKTIFGEKGAREVRRQLEGNPKGDETDIRRDESPESETIAGG